MLIKTDQKQLTMKYVVKMSQTPNKCYKSLKVSKDRCKVSSKFEWARNMHTCVFFLPCQDSPPGQAVWKKGNKELSSSHSCPIPKNTCQFVVPGRLIITLATAEHGGKSIERSHFQLPLLPLLLLLLLLTTYFIQLTRSHLSVRS